MDSNFEVIKSIYENECQRIVECKEIKTGENYIYNIIYNPKLMKLIDVNTLNSINSNIVKCQKTQDRLYIVTKFHELNNQKFLKDYIDENTLTLKQQFSLTQQLINLFIQIYNTTDLLQYKILNFDNLSVDEDNNIFVNGYFEFKDEYDLSDNYSYKNVGKMIHYVFSKEEIVDYNISDTIPPDVLKIIVKCLTREYFHPKDTLKDLESSPIYSLINCKTDSYAIDKKLFEDEDYKTLSNRAKSAIENEDEFEKSEKLNKAVVIAPSALSNEPSSEIIKDELLNDEVFDDELLDESDSSSPDNPEDLSSDNFEDLPPDDLDDEGLPSEFYEESELDDSLAGGEDESNVIDIFLSDSVADKNNAVENKEEKDKDKGYMKFVIPIIIIVFILTVGFFVIRALFGESKPVSGDDLDNIGKVEDNKPNEDNKTDDNSPDKDKPAVNPDNSDFKLYFNDELINKIGYTGKLATISTETFSTGNSSLMVENDSTETERILFAVIDFTNDKLSYMRNNTVSVTPMFKASKDLDAKLVVEVYLDGKLMTNKAGKISIPDDIWIKNGITVDTEKIDRVNLYLEFEGKNKIWIDNISVEIMK